MKGLFLQTLEAVLLKMWSVWVVASDSVAGTEVVALLHVRHMPGHKRLSVGIKSHKPGVNGLQVSIGSCTPLHSYFSVVVVTVVAVAVTPLVVVVVDVIGTQALH
jgi:hypothetical protein